MSQRIYGITSARNHAYAVAAALSYWVFRCRDRKKSAANGTKTWTFLESSIQNAALPSSTLEGFIQRLSNSLLSQLRPQELTHILQPEQVILRASRNSEGGIADIQEKMGDENLAWMSWLDLVEDLKHHNFEEWDVLEICRNQPAIVQVLCRLRFEEDKALGKVDFIEVEAENV